MNASRSARYIGEVVLGQYKIEHSVGEGSFAWVYRAQDPKGQPVAIKVLYNPQETAAVRFAREIRVLRALPENPYVVRYIKHGHMSDGKPVMALEFVDGMTLKRGMKSRPALTPEPVVSLVAELCEAFVDLHQLGVAHRDVKPENILMAREGGIKLIDFGLIRDAQGILKLLEEQDPLEAQLFSDDLDRGVLAGTPEYMAPEQFSDSTIKDSEQTRTDTWSDVFSLGVILFELLTGKKPFKMKQVPQNEYPKELLRYLRYRLKLKDRDLPPLPKVDVGLQSIVKKALKRDPRMRQPNAQTLMEDLLHYQKTGEGVREADDSRTMIASVFQKTLPIPRSEMSTAVARPKFPKKVSATFFETPDSLHEEQTATVRAVPLHEEQTATLKAIPEKQTETTKRDETPSDLTPWELTETQSADGEELQTTIYHSSPPQGVETPEERWPEENLAKLENQDEPDIPRAPLDTQILCKDKFFSTSPERSQRDWNDDNDEAEEINLADIADFQSMKNSNFGEP